MRSRIASKTTNRSVRVRRPRPALGITVYARKRRWKVGIHYGFAAYGLSAFAGALAIIAIRAVRPHAFPITVDRHMQAEIAIGGAIISYFIAAFERKAKAVSEGVTALAVGFIALMALRYSTAEWKSVQTIFALTAVMKPISARVAEYLSATALER